MTATYQNWKFEIDADKILWLGFDRADSNVNTISADTLIEFNNIMDQMNLGELSGVIIYSEKTSGFIAGADINQFVALKTKEQAFELVRKAQVIFDRLEALKIPSVAMINGFCMGGGTELALACRYRIATDNLKTRIGLPEVKLGLHPGWGGTVRLPPLVGAIEAMKMILPGAAYTAAKALKVGIIDAAVPLRELKSAARHFILNKPLRHQPSGLARFSNHALVRPILGKLFYNQLRAKGVRKAHYPAPFAVIRNWIRDGGFGQAAMVNEARSISELILTPTSRNLVRDFFLQTKLKNLAKAAKYKATKVHVVGAGTMG
ncbi:MAG: enoyl-CoA hydratase/isomerase family protein, partial [Gammaproteobacteria bacterium]|nr:enoyl-CoA hydratase/isomerase family protein [Gammaproteobacteria bacterium]